MFSDLKIPAGRRPLTRGERRITALFGLGLLVILFAVVFENYSPQNLGILFFILFWVPMLVVHECGHALMAKLLGWRVREIVIGFGRKLTEFRIGETRVTLKWFPLEGYVLPAPVVPSQIRLKSLLIYAAGPGAELLVLAGLILGFGWNTVWNESQDIPLIALESLAIVIVMGAGFNLIPFRTEGAVSDGLGILSSPFMNRETIELRLLSAELRELGRMLDAGRSADALVLARAQLKRYPDNLHLQHLYVTALSADGQDEAARDYVGDHLDRNDLPGDQRMGWLQLQARVELDAAEPDLMTLDLAVQRALRLTPNAPGLLAVKGASLVLRGQSEMGGDLLAHAWRRNDGSADDAFMLAYLTIAAHRCDAREAYAHFRQSFRLVNRSKALKERVEALTDTSD